MGVVYEFPVVTSVPPQEPVYQYIVDPGTEADSVEEPFVPHIAEGEAVGVGTVDSSIVTVTLPCVPHPQPLYGLK